MAVQREECAKQDAILHTAAATVGRSPPGASPFTMMMILRMWVLVVVQHHHPTQDTVGSCCILDHGSTNNTNIKSLAHSQDQQ